MSTIQEREDDEDITPSNTSRGDEEDQRGCPAHSHHDGGLVQLELESILDSRTSSR